MSSPGAPPLLIDTGAFYARYDESASRHERATAVFDAIASGEVQYQPLYTTTHVLVELATLLMRKRGHTTAVRGLTRIRESAAFTVVHPTEDEFDDTCAQLERYDDQGITLVDHLTAVVADERDTDHIFAFDSDFRTLGYTLVPADVRIPGLDDT